MTLYRETPCDHGWIKPHPNCPGGSREEVTIDYEAGRGTAFRLRHKFMAGMFDEVSQSIIDAALHTEKEPASTV